MAYNVGTAQGKFILDGVRQSIKDLLQLRKGLQSVNLDYKTQRKLMMEVIEVTKQKNALARQVFGNERFVAGAIKQTNRAIQERVSAMKWLQKIDYSKGLNAALSRNVAEANRTQMANIRGALSGYSPNKSIVNYFRQLGAQTGATNERLKSFIGFSRVAATVSHEVATQVAKEANALRQKAAATTKDTAAQHQNNMAKVKALFNVKNLGARIKNYAMATKDASQATNMWWRNFGRVAIGFSIAYRLINAVEYGIRQITEAFKAGITVADDYRSSVSNISGMLALLSSGLSGFTERYDKFTRVMKGTMRESYRLMPEFGLSTGDISNAYRELAQFGVVVKRDMVRPSLNAIAVIKEIASTTGNTARQVRQEIQAMFTGQTRVTDQFGRMIKNSMPELADKIFGIARANTSNAEKWKLVISAMNEYNRALIDSRQTLTAQGEIAKNSLSIISRFAIEGSGLYDKWLNKLKDFNKALFTNEGTLTDFGQKIYAVFYRGWQIIDIAVTTLGRLVVYIVKAVKAAYEWYPPLTRALLFLVKIRVTTFLIREAFVGVWTVAKFIIGPVRAILKLFFVLKATLMTSILPALKAIWASLIMLMKGMILGILNPLTKIRNVMFMVRGAAVSTAGVFLGWAAAIVATFAVAYTLGAAINGIIEGIGNSIGTLIEGFKSIEMSATDWLMLASPLTAGPLIAKKMGEMMENVGEKASTEFTLGFNKGFRQSFSALGDLKDWAVGKLKDLGSWIYDMFAGPIDKLKAKFREMFPELSEGFGELKEFKFEDFDIPKDWLDGIKFAGAGLDEVNKKLEKLREKLLDFYKTWYEMAGEMGREMAQANMDKFEKQVHELNIKIGEMKVKLAETFQKVDFKELGISEDQAKKLWENFIASADKYFEEYRKFKINQINLEKKYEALLHQEYYIKEAINNLELDYQSYRLGEKEYLQEQIGLWQQILQLKVLALSQTPVTDERFIELMRDINEVNRRIRELQIQNQRHVGGAIAGFKQGIAKYTRELGTRFDAWEKMAQNVAGEMQGAFEEYFFDALNGDFQSFEDFFTNFGKNLNRILAQMLAQMTMQWIASSALWRALMPGGGGGGFGTSYSYNGTGGLGGFVSQFGGMFLGMGGSMFGGGGTPSTFGLDESGAFGGYSNFSGSLAPAGMLPDYSNWMTYDSGGLITEPVLGIGKSGKLYSFVEDGKPEQVLSNAATREYKDRGVYSVNVPVNVQNGDNNLAAELQRGIERTVEDILRRHS